ncbi:MAG: cation:proton antiporter [Ardenticatenaceae bacterium]|nr:cation:proton antiporter [Ardenticatenaceae bacterium]
MLGFASKEVVESLRFIDEISLAFIAFAAGSELYLPEIRGRLRSIGLVTAVIVFVTVLGGTLAVFLLADFIPFMQEFSVSSQVAIALMAATIMVLRSPSVAIALINELRSRSSHLPSWLLGVTVISDVLVIVLFAISADIADAILTGVSINLGLLLLLAVELLLSVGLGIALSRVLLWIINRHWQLWLKTAVILAIGFAVFLLSSWIRDFTHENLPVEILLEPLLICMVAGFIINNFSKCRLEFARILHDAGRSSTWPFSRWWAKGSSWTFCSRCGHRSGVSAYSRGGHFNWLLWRRHSRWGFSQEQSVQMDGVCDAGRGGLGAGQRGRGGVPRLG